MADFTQRDSVQARGWITLLKDYGDTATFSNNFFIFALFKYNFYHKSKLLLTVFLPLIFAVISVYTNFSFYLLIRDDT